MAFFVGRHRRHCHVQSRQKVAKFDNVNAAGDVCRFYHRFLPIRRYFVRLCLCVCACVCIVYTVYTCTHTRIYGYALDKDDI